MLKGQGNAHEANYVARTTFIMFFLHFLLPSLTFRKTI
jgi:hypothetical protein